MNPFTFHTSYEYKPTGTDQHKGQCPFCLKEDHFFFGSDFQWDCKICKERGNLYTFLSLLHSRICTYGQVAELAASRCIPLTYFKLSDIKYNPLNSSYVIPTFNKDGNLNNLYKVCHKPKKTASLNGHPSLASQSPDRQSYLILCTPTLEATLFNFPQRTEQEVWLCEGHMDKLAAEAIIGPRKITCMGYPGSTFKQPWTNPIASRDLVILSDNDNGGKTNLELILKRIENAPQKPKSIRRINWPSNSPVGYDINDILIDYGPNAFEYIQNNLIICSSESQLLPVPISADVSCDTFEKLVSECSLAYHFTFDMELLLLAMLSSVYSLKIEGEQLWFRIIGPPGSSKTTLAQITGSSEQTVLQSTFTGLLSGWKDEQETDASLIPLIAGKALIVKDADALLQQPNVAQIMSELRDFYDKNTSVTYRNRVSFDYKNIRSSFLFCGTTALRGIDNTALGERFLDFELHVSEADRRAMTMHRIRRARIEGTSGLSPENKVWDKAKGFIDHHLLSQSGVADLTDHEDLLCYEYGNLVSFMRAKVNRDFKGNIKYAPYPEVPTRLGGQLTKLFQCAPLIFRSSSIPPIVYKLAARITGDIICRQSPRYKIARALYVEPNQKGDDVVLMTGLPAQQAEIEVADMIALGMIDLTHTRTSTQHVIYKFSLKPQLYEQFERLES